MKRGLFFLVILLIFIFQDVESQTTVVLQPGPEGKDAIVHGFWPDRNLGDSNDLYIMAWTFSGGNPAAVRSYLEFDLSFLSAQAVIIEAKLSLFYQVGLENPGLTNYGDNQSFIKRVITDWDEHLITWNNQPSTTDENAVWLPSSTSPNQDYLDIDVTQLIQDIVTNPENSHGFCIKLVTEQEYRALCFATGDHVEKDLHPKLFLKYIDCETPTVSFNYILDGQTVNFESICPSAQSWFWDFGDGYLSTLQNPVHEYLEQGQYEVCLTVEDSCGEAEYCEWIDVCDEPVAGYSFNTEELTVFFTDTSRISNGWFWDFGDGYYSDLQNPWHTYDTSGYYYVCLNAWNDCSEDTVCKGIFVDFSGWQEIDVPPISIYPNPAKDRLFIRAEYNYPISISILTLQGIPLFEGSFILSNGVSAIDISRIPAGIHIVQMKSREFIWNTKLIIQ